MAARHPLFQPLIWNAEADALLGTISDRDVAKLVGVDPKTARARRLRLGIPVYCLPHVWTAAEDALLGTMSDRELGQRMTLSPRTVQARRRLLNIAAWCIPKKVHQRRCVVCGKPFKVVGGRLSEMRQTCPPEHQFTRAGRISEHHKRLIADNQLAHQAKHNPTSLNSLLRKAPGMKFLDRLDA